MPSPQVERILAGIDAILGEVRTWMPVLLEARPTEDLSGVVAALDAGLAEVQSVSRQLADDAVDNETVEPPAAEVPAVEDVEVVPAPAVDEEPAAEAPAAPAGDVITPPTAAGAATGADAVVPAGAGTETGPAPTPGPAASPAATGTATGLGNSGEAEIAPLG